MKYILTGLKHLLYWTPFSGAYCNESVKYIPVVPKYSVYPVYEVFYIQDAPCYPLKRGGNCVLVAGFRYIVSS